MAKRQNITVVMSLHEIDLACKVSDKIVCVKGGHIAGCGTPDEIFSDERINSLYEIDRGAYNSLLGSVELARPTGDVRAFVVGGNGCGVRFYRELQKRGIPFAAGILYKNDIDCAVASPLASELVSVDAFEPIPDSAVERAKGIIDRVDIVIDCGCLIGEYNRANRELLDYAGGKVRYEVGNKFPTSDKRVL